MRVPLLILTIGLVLVGCTREYRMEVHAKRCNEYGFEKGTTAYAECLQREEINWGNP